MCNQALQVGVQSLIYYGVDVLHCRFFGLGSQPDATGFQFSAQAVTNGINLMLPQA